MYIPLVTDFFALIMRFIMTAITSNFGLAIILFTLLTKILLFPFQLKSKKGMLDQRRIAPKRAALEKKYKGNPQKLNEEIQKLYKSEGVSLMGGCLPLLITIPILMGLYGVVYRPMTHLMYMDSEQIKTVGNEIVSMYKEGTYVNQNNLPEEFFTTLEKQLSEGGKMVNELRLAHAMNGNVPALQDTHNKLFNINFNFLGLDLGSMPSYRPFNTLMILPILSAFFAYLQGWLAQRTNAKMNDGVTGAEQAASMGKGMLYTMPLLSLWIGLSLPAGVTLYWIVNNILSIAQEPLLNSIAEKKYGGMPVVEEKAKKKAPPAVESTGEEVDPSE
jgi:YidC/Oxa1 family membrane protein insertase